MLKSRYFSTRVRATRHCIGLFMPDFKGAGKGKLAILTSSCSRKPRLNKQVQIQMQALYFSQHFIARFTTLSNEVLISFANKLLRIWKRRCLCRICKQLFCNSLTDFISISRWISAHTSNVFCKRTP